MATGRRGGHEQLDLRLAAVATAAVEPYWDKQWGIDRDGQ